MPGLSGLSALTGDSAIFGGGIGGYVGKVLGYGPAAYWVLGEAAGPTAICQVNSPAQDGTYAGVTLGQPGIGDGNTCPFFDGINDVVDVLSAPLQAAFSAATGSILIWCRVFNLGVWTDAAFRQGFRFFVNPNNRIYPALKHSAINYFLANYRAGGVSVVTDVVPFNNTGWMCVLHTWDTGANAVNWYINGVPVDSPQGGLGVWAGAFASATIGAADLVPTDPWHGWIAHTAVFAVTLGGADAADLAVI